MVKRGEECLVRFLDVIVDSGFFTDRGNNGTTFSGRFLRTDTRHVCRICMSKQSEATRFGDGENSDADV